VVQEGLTNALKHAPGQPVRVELDAGTDHLVVTVRSVRPTSPRTVRGRPARPPPPSAERASGRLPSTSTPRAARSRPARPTVTTFSVRSCAPRPAVRAPTPGVVHPSPVTTPPPPHRHPRAECTGTPGRSLTAWFAPVVAAGRCC
jgi:hypothetical protein